MVPALYDAVPPTVVNRTRSNVPLRVTAPAPKWFCPLRVSAVIEEKVHVFDPNKQIVAIPENGVAEPTLLFTGNPVVMFPDDVLGAIKELADV